MRSIGIAAAAFLFVSASPATDIPEALRKSIASGNQEWIDGIKAHDAARIAATYDEQGINCSAKGDCVKGRAAIESQMAPGVKKMPAVADAWVKSAGTVVDGELAYEWGSAGFRFADGKEFAGRYLTAWRKQPDGSWKIFHNASLPR
ncbi:MAG TPA: SgcJ/EcaC family oxidoreductase [Myxococcales bacterium]|nr:SgcJ/EcaC family oxidoreductase [Myxococcales bacterium]